VRRMVAMGRKPALWYRARFKYGVHI